MSQKGLAAETTIAFLPGKGLRPGTVMNQVHDHLQELGSAVLVVTERPLPAWLATSHVVVHRGLTLADLRAATPLETAGTRFCNRIAATIGVRDRALVAEKLSAHDLPVPITTPAASWPEVLEIAREATVVVKANQALGRGRAVLTIGSGSAPLQPPFTGPYVVQEFIRCDERDYKVYVVGDEVRGLAKWRSPETAESMVAPFAVDAKLAALARRVGDALELEIYGVDFLFGPNGPVVVDVNPFPGFRGIPHAAGLIVKYLMDLDRSG